MSDSDDDLLELAGIGSDEESDYEPQLSKGKRGSSKRTIEESDIEEGEDEEDEDELDQLNPDDDPYPLEGKYKDEADKMQLMQMDEVSREGILYDRIQEKERFRERRFLALRARQSKVESKTIQKGSSSKKLKTSKLSELKKQRERKSNKETHRDDDDYYDDDRIDEEEYEDQDLKNIGGYDDDLGEDDEGYYSDDYAPERRSRRSEYDQSQYQDASLDDINNKIRSTRNTLAQFLYRDEFDECIPGTLVRVSVGPSRTTNRPQYRMALVEEVRRGGKPYKLLGKLCNTYLKVSQGDSSTVVDVACLSNSPFTTEDFEMYKKRISTSRNHSLPTVRYVEDKFLQLKNMATRTLTDVDINRMMARKQELAVHDMNTTERVRQLGRLREELQVALERGDSVLANSLQDQIDRLSKFFKGTQNTSKLEQINIRNQKSNQEYIRKAEKKLVETKRKQLQNNDFSDPFSRLRTNPKVFYKSVDKTDENKEQAEKDVKDVEDEKNQIKNSIFRREGIDALIKNIDIDFDFEI